MEIAQGISVTVHSPSGYQRENKTFAIFSEGGVNNYGKSSIEFYGTNIKSTLLLVVIGGLFGYFLGKIYFWVGSYHRNQITKKITTNR